MSDAAGFLRHFHACNRHDLGKFVPFFIGAQRLGRVKKKLADLLLRKTGFFVPQQGGLALAPRFDGFDARSEALAAAAEWIAERRGRAMRREMYPVFERWGDAPLAQIDRTAVPWFGIKAYGVHVNGFVRKKDGLHLWIGERAKNRQVEPGKLDNLVGGGQPIGLTIEQNLIKEAEEEASIGAALAGTAKQTGTIGYLLERPKGLRDDVLFVFDLELPADFTPRNADGEMAGFHLMPLAEVAAIVRDTDRFKFNCNLVITDFLIRHGFLTAEHPEYREIIEWLNKKERSI